MKHKIAWSIAAAIAVTLLYHCTDVPLSFSKKIIDERIVGCWQDSDTTAFQVNKNSDGTASLLGYEYDRETGSYHTDGKPHLLYFTSITDKSGTLNFFSMQDESDGTTYYHSARFSFSSDGALFIDAINTEFLEKYNKKSNNKGIVVFGTSKKYKAFVKANMRLAELYEDRQTWQKRANF